MFVPGLKVMKINKEGVYMKTGILIKIMFF